MPQHITYSHAKPGVRLDKHTGSRACARVPSRSHAQACEWSREGQRERLWSQLCRGKSCQVEGRKSELKADDKMTDELSPDGLHIFTSQSHNTHIILHIFAQFFSRFKIVFLCMILPLHTLLAEAYLSHGLAGSGPPAPLFSQADQFSFLAEAIWRRESVCGFFFPF